VAPQSWSVTMIYTLTHSSHDLTFSNLNITSSQGLF